MRGQRLLILALALGTFASTAANTLVNVPLGVMTADLGAPLRAGSRIVVAFNLTCAVVLPVAGWLGRRRGLRQIFLVSMVGVVLGALGAACAPTLGVLVAFRAVQGVAGALALPTVLALLVEVAGPGRRARAVSWWATANGAGQAAGPTLGGVLADLAGWRSVFLVVVPFAATAFVAAHRLAPPGSGRATPLDRLGALTLAAGTGLLLAAASAATTAASTVGATVALTCGSGGVLVLVVFVVVERRRPAPFLSPALFVEPRFLRSSVAALAQMFCLTATLLAIPLYLTLHAGNSARVAGALVVALPLAMTLGAPLAGLVTERWSPRRALRAGLSALGLAELVLGALILRGGDGVLATVLLVAVVAAVGLGMAFTQTPATAGATRSAQEADSASALGVFNMVRFVGAALGGTAVAVVVGDHPIGTTPFALAAAVCAAAAVGALVLTFVGTIPDARPPATPRASGRSGVGTGAAPRH